MGFKLVGKLEQAKSTYPTFDVIHDKKTGVVNVVLKRDKEYNAMNLE
jgi:hypothetical protein